MISYSDVEQYFIMSCHRNFLQFFTIFVFIFAGKPENITNVVNLEVYSKVDLNNQLVHVKDMIVFSNTASTILRSYLYIINEPELHFVTFYNQQGKELNYKINNTNGSDSVFEVTLDEGVGGNQQYTLFCKVIYANKILPAHRKRKIAEDQLMKYEGNVRFFSPYKTVFFRIEYLMISDSLEDVTKRPTHSLSDKIVYLFYDIESYSVDHIELIFINNDPFLVIKNLKRTIDVSHFGKISIEDSVVIQNNGAKFVGPYMDSSQMKIKGGTTWLYTHLPASAENIKFFDIIGNSSQTRIYNFLNYITLKFKTRYPLLGGWKTSYALQYDVFTHEYLFTTSNNNYFLKIRGIDYVLNDKVIENAVVRIVLPEGAYYKQLSIPKGLSLNNEEVSCLGGLCVFGRQTIVLNGTNLFENHIATVSVQYFFNPLYLFRAPLVISCYMQLIFIIILCGKYFVL